MPVDGTTLSPPPGNDGRSTQMGIDRIAETYRIGNSKNTMERRTSAASCEVSPLATSRTNSGPLVGRMSPLRRLSHSQFTKDAVSRLSSWGQDGSPTTPKAPLPPTPKAPTSEKSLKMKLESCVHVPYPPEVTGRRAATFDLIIVYLFHGEGKHSHRAFFDDPAATTRDAPIAIPTDGTVPTFKVEAPKISTDDPPHAQNWLNHRRMLPKLLPDIRTICIGYQLKIPSKDNLASLVDLEQASSDFYRHLEDERRECPDRPAILIGHGFGARIIQEAAARGSSTRHSVFVSEICAGIILQDMPLGLNLSRMMRDRSIPVHSLPSEKEQTLGLGFSNPRNKIFQLLATKIVESFETFQLMDALRKSDFKRAKSMILNGTDVNKRKDANSRTALHVACGSSRFGRDDIAWLVDKGNADVTLVDNSTKTALHFALERNPPDEGIVRVLLEFGADPHATDSKKRTAIHLARSQRIRNLLLDPPPIHGPSTEIGSVGVPHFPHSFSAIKACRLHEMIATEIYLTRENDTVADSYLSRGFSVEEAVYGPRNLQTLLKDTRDEYRNKVICRWYHLPANNMVWVDDLFRNRFQMHPVVWSEQFRDSEWPHGRCINPHAAQFLAETRESVLAICMPYLSYENNERQRAYSKLVKKQIRNGGEEQESEGSIAPMSAWQYKQNRRFIFDPAANISSSLTIPPESRKDSSDLVREGTHTGAGDIRLTDSFSGSDEYRSAQTQTGATSTDDSDSGSEGKVSKRGPRAVADNKTAGSQKEKALLQAYLRRQPPLHIRRTLDQYYYYMLEDTRVRDDDQVVGRWAKNSLGRDPHNILMVDQLWLWVIKGDRGQPDKVITCFPDRQGIGSGSLDNLHHNILEKKLRKHRPFQNTAMLVSRIIATCSNVFTWSQEGDLVRFVQFFEATVGKVGDRETELLEQFKNQSLALHNLKPRFRNYSKEKDRLLEDLLDIRPQTDLLKEVKDILDEIKIILHVLEEQQRVLELPDISAAFSKAVESDQKAPKRKKKASMSSPTWDPCREPLKIIRQAIGAFQRMEKQTKEVYDGLNHLLDLQQKQATVWEAKSTREGAKATSKQGNVMVVFTTVTIIFLPLSFMASFFALDVDEFPQTPQGQTNWSLSRVCTLLFCISFGLIIPFIVLAFLAGRLRGTFSRAKYGCIFPVILAVMQALYRLAPKRKSTIFTTWCDRIIKNMQKHRAQYYNPPLPTDESSIEPEIRNDRLDELPLSELSEDSGSEYGPEKYGRRAMPTRRYRDRSPGVMV